MKKRKIVIGNWKMNPESAKEAKKLNDSIRQKISKVKKAVAVICPPSIFLEVIKGKSTSKKIFYGVQDISKEERGSHTGEISAVMAKNSGALFSIVGHSERRKAGETDEEISKKIVALLNTKMHPILCVGEEEVDEHGGHLIQIKGQLEKSLAGVALGDIGRVFIAYEPVYAIGASEPVTSRTIHHRSIFIRKVLADLYGKKAAFDAVIVYGGSANASNAEELVSGGDVDGLLVGRASLDPNDFSAILKTLDKIS